MTTPLRSWLGKRRAVFNSLPSRDCEGAVIKTQRDELGLTSSPATGYLGTVSITSAAGKAK